MFPTMPWHKMILPASLVLGALLLASALLLLLQPAPLTPVEGAPQTGAAPSWRPRETAKFDFGGTDHSPSMAVAENTAPDIAAPETEPTLSDMPAWESSVNAILESAEDNNTVAAKLDALSLSLPLDGRVEATQHMVNLLGDESYQLARGKLANPATPREVMDVIYSDVLNRPNTVKLPALVDVLAVPGHPLHAESLETLRVFVGKDVGTDASAWNAAVQEFLREEARQEMEAAAPPAAP